MMPSTRALAGTANQLSANQSSYGLFNKGVALGALGRGEEAITVYDALDVRFGGDGKSAIRERSPGRCSTRASRSARSGAARKRSQFVMCSTRASAEIANRPFVSRSPARCSTKASGSVRSGAASKRSPSMTPSTRASAGTANRPSATEVAGALVQQGQPAKVRSGAVRKPSPSMPLIDARFGGDREPAIRQRVVKALVNMGVTLGKFGRVEQAVAVCDALDERFGEDSEPAIREGVVRGQVLRGNLKYDAHGEVDAAELAYRRAISLDSKSP